MAKGAYFGVNSLAKKIKKMYIGVGGVAHKVKKAYIGIAGKARVWFSGGEPAYYGEIAQLSTGRNILAAVAVGDYALFGGGVDSNGNASNVVDAYSKSLVRTTATALSETSSALAGASCGEFGIFAGGGAYANRYSSTVNAYNSSLIRTNPTSLSTTRRGLCGEKAGNYAVFMGGYASSDRTTVDAYSPSLTRTTAAALSVGRRRAGSATFGDYAIIAGGYHEGSDKSNVDAYNSSLTHITSYLGSAREELAGGGTNNHAIFCGGGQNGVTSFNWMTVEAFDNSLTRTKLQDLNDEMVEGNGINFDGVAVFGFSKSYYNIVPREVYVFDESLTRKSNLYINTPRCDVASAVIGGYALFGGGFDEIKDKTSSIVDAFTM